MPKTAKRRGRRAAHLYWGGIIYDESSQYSGVSYDENGISTDYGNEHSAGIYAGVKRGPVGFGVYAGFSMELPSPEDKE